MDKLLAGRRVLVIEDEMLVLMDNEDMLADLGCESVTAAATNDKAVALVEGQVFDIAMLDMNLNGHSSRPVADPSLRVRCRFSFRLATALKQCGKISASTPYFGNRSPKKRSHVCSHNCSLVKRLILATR